MVQCHVELPKTSYVFMALAQGVRYEMELCRCFLDPVLP